MFFFLHLATIFFWAFERVKSLWQCDGQALTAFYQHILASICIAIFLLSGGMDWGRMDALDRSQTSRSIASGYVFTKSSNKVVDKNVSKIYNSLELSLALVSE
jgi:hypothetical protein